MQRRWKAYLLALSFVLLAVFALTPTSRVKADDDQDGNALTPLQADGSGALVVRDTDPQTAVLKGNAGIGAHGAVSFQLSNIDIQRSGTCSTKQGTATITASDGESKINMVLTGLGCAIHVSPFPATVTAAYVITGGTGIFAKTVGGTGSFSWGILADVTPGSAYWIHIGGNIQRIADED